MENKTGSLFANNNIAEPMDNEIHVPDIPNLVKEYYTNKATNYPVRTNQASQIGHPCLRYLVYNRTNWQDKQPPSPELMQIFNEGNLQEDAILKLLQDIGIKVISQQAPLEMMEYQISGRIDGIVLSNGNRFPLEIKTMSPFIFQTINTVSDFVLYPWTKKYKAQLMLYMLMKNLELGMFILKNKSTGRLKQLMLELDYDYAESLLHKAEMINENIKNETLPERLPATDKECNDCVFAHLCLPERVNKGDLEIEDSPELLAAVIRLKQIESDVKEIKPVEKEVKQIRDWIKKQTEGKELVSVGDYLIEGKYIERKAHEIKASTYWKMKISKL